MKHDMRPEIIRVEFHPESSSSPTEATVELPESELRKEGKHTRLVQRATDWLDEYDRVIAEDHSNQVKSQMAKMYGNTRLLIADLLAYARVHPRSKGGEGELAEEIVDIVAGTQDNVGNIDWPDAIAKVKSVITHTPSVESEAAWRPIEELHALRQQIEDTIAVAETEQDGDGFITAYHFKTGAIHRLLARARQGDSHVIREAETKYGRSHREDEVREALADFQREMEEHTIPEIQRAMDERAELAEEARHRSFRPPPQSQQEDKERE